MTRARVILNPSSGRERGPEHLEVLTRGLRDAYTDIEVVVTAGDGDAQRAARRAADDGCDALFVAGGDGTVNEAVNGLAAGGFLDRMTIGIIPFGTGNDFAAALDLPLELEPALETLLHRRVLRVDLGEVNGRVFVNTSGGGFIAEVSEAVTPQLKTIAGRLAYLIGGAQTLIDFEPVGATVVFDGGDRLRRDLYAFAVCNSRSIGGGRLIAPDAFIDDGLLDVCLIERMTALEFVALARKVASGEHVEDPRVHYRQSAAVDIELDRPARINTDGEVFEGSRCEYRVLPGAARFLAGPSPCAIGTRG